MATVESERRPDADERNAVEAHVGSTARRTMVLLEGLLDHPLDHPLDQGLELPEVAKPSDFHARSAH